jgi:sugar phosphate isomerase/epimerase
MTEVRRRALLGAALALPATLVAAGTAAAFGGAPGAGAAPLSTRRSSTTSRSRSSTPSSPSSPSSSSSGPPPAYYTGDYKVSLNLYSFNVNLIAWVDNRRGAPPLDTLSAVKWARTAGFEGVDVPMYYVPGYSGTAMPTASTASIKSFVDQIKATAAASGLPVTGTGIGNDFATPDAAARSLDVQRARFWIDMAAELGAPLFRVFSGLVPADLATAGGWAGVAQSRIVPALQDITAYAAGRGVKVVLQNHGDMTATADQTIQIMHWVGSPNLVLLDDTGYFRPFQATTGAGYDWYGDIDKLLPYSGDIQVKLKPAGADSAGPLMNFDQLFSGLRSSPYRGFVNLERLWAKTDPDNPKTQSAPPYAEVSQFLTQVRTALAATKAGPVG